MPFESTLGSVAFWVCGLTLGLGLRVLILQASWAFAGLDDPPLSRVLIAVPPLWIIAFVGGVLLDNYYFKPMGSPNGFGLPRVGGLILVIALASLLDLGLYLPVLRPTPKSALFIALFEIALTLLAAVLIAAIIFVVVAIAQVANRADAGPIVPTTLAYVTSVRPL